MPRLCRSRYQSFLPPRHWHKGVQRVPSQTSCVALARKLNRYHALLSILSLRLLAVVHKRVHPNLRLLRLLMPAHLPLPRCALHGGCATIRQYYRGQKAQIPRSSNVSLARHHKAIGCPLKALHPVNYRKSWPKLPQLVSLSQMEVRSFGTHPAVHLPSDSRFVRLQLCRNPQSVSTWVLSHEVVNAYLRRVLSP